MTRLIVGKKETGFCVHHKILAASSNFFKYKKNQPGGPFKNRYYRTDWDPDIFNTYLKWLYTRHLPIRQPEIDDDADLCAPGRYDDGEYSRLANLYLFGVEIEAADFQDAVLDKIATRAETACDDKYKQLPGYVAITKIYEETPRGCKARKLLTEIYALAASEKDVEVERGLLPAAFLEDLATRLIAKKTSPGGKLEKNDFHCAPSARGTKRSYSALEDIK